MVVTFGLAEDIMNRRSFIHGVASAVVAVSSRLLPPVARAQERKTPADLGDLLEAIRKEHKLPGLAAAVARGDQIVAEGVAGVRQVGKEDKITLEDRFRLASCTKRMTAAMIGRVIDAGKLSFDSTLAATLPDIQMRDDYTAVTLAQLLTFTGGIQPYTRIGPRLTPILFQLKGSAAEQREQFVKHLLQEAPVVKPGTESKYSNASYALAAFMAERRTGRSWETLMQQEVFKPLAMNHAGFGRPWSKEHPHEPWFHVKGENGYELEPEERPGGPGLALAAAGAVHCSIRDFITFGSYELAAAQGKNRLLKPATAKRWQEVSRKPMDGWAFFGGSQSISAGCQIWPSKNLAVVAAINAGSADGACKAVLEAARRKVEA
jgi:CubicO group peptidase (beta-lactamase class C family)